MKNVSFRAKRPERAEAKEPPHFARTTTKPTPHPPHMPRTHHRPQRHRKDRAQQHCRQKHHAQPATAKLATSRAAWFTVADSTAPSTICSSTNQGPSVANSSIATSPAPAISSANTPHEYAIFTIRTQYFGNVVDELCGLLHSL